MAVCASCVFGAVSSAILSFSYTAIETLTVKVIPHVTEYPNGTRITSNETITQEITEIIGTSYNSSGLETFTNINHITWTVDDATLTWPTTYVQYLGFQGAPLTSGQSCAQAGAATSVALPSNTDPASFIYPLGADGTTLPTPLLSYLGQLDTIASQFDGLALTGCAPLGGPITARHEPRRKQKRFEGARQNDALNARTASSAFIHANRTSIEHAQSSTSSALPSSTSSEAASSNPSFTGLASISSSLVSNPGDASSSISLSSSSTGVTLTKSHGIVIASNETCVMGNGTSNGNSNSTCSVVSSVTGTGTVSGPRGHHPEPQSTEVVSSAAPYHHKPAFGLTTITLPEQVTHVTGDPKTSKHSSKHRSTGHNSDANPNENTPAPMHTPGNQPGQHDPSPGGGQSTRHHNVSPQTAPTGQNPGNGKPGADPSGNGNPVFSVGTTKITEKPGGVIIGQHTVHPGQKITFGSGGSKTTVALQTKGGTTRLVVDGTTYKARPGGGTTSDPGSPTANSPQVVITTNGHTFTAIRSGDSIIVKDGHSKTTIPAGAKVTFDGQTISAPQGGSRIIVNGNPEPLTSAPEVVITANGHTFTAVDESGSVVLEDGTSTMKVKDGSVATFEGQTVSVGKQGTVVVVNGRTILVTETTTQTLTGSASLSSIAAANSSAGTRHGISMWAIQVSCLAICFLFGVIMLL